MQDYENTIIKQMKRFSNKTRLGLFLFFLIVMIMLASIICMAQFEPAPFKKPVKDVTDSVIVNYERLKREVGNNKVMPSEYEKQILFALSYFPELANTKIEFQFKKSKSGIIDTRPTIGSLLRNGSKRKYLVTIYNSVAGRTLSTFSNADVNAQVGILGHELCHIVYLKHSTGFGLLGLGIAHVSTRYMDGFENKTDSMDIERGLGYQLIAWKKYLDIGFKAMPLNESQPLQKSPARERYMSVEHILQVIAKSKVYQ
jgi:hypothetical protein